MSKISVIVPTHNDQSTVLGFAKELINVCETQLSHYDYEIIFVDNNSSDLTKEYLKKLCAITQKVKCLFTVANYGSELAAKFGMTASDGDCVITILPDFSHPVSVIPRMLELWSEGSKIIIGAKSKSAGNPISNGLRNLYCNAVYKLTGTKMMRQFTGLCLYDRSFVKTINSKAYKNMQIRSIINTLKLSYMVLPFVPSKAAPHMSFSQRYDRAMLSMTTYPKGAIRAVSMVGFFGGALSLLAGLVTLIMKFFMWNSFSVSVPALLCLGGVLLIITAVTAEYVSRLCQNADAATFVKEEERINFSSQDKKSDN